MTEGTYHQRSGQTGSTSEDVSLSQTKAFTGKFKTLYDIVIMIINNIFIF